MYMKIEDGIIRQLTAMEYQQLDIKISTIEMFYHSDSMGTKIVLIIRAISGNEISPNEYKHIIRNIKERFVESGFMDIHVLGLVLTATPDRARHLYYDEEDHFIIDLWDRRLLVFENQSPYFASLIPALEDIIHDESYSTGLDERDYVRGNGSNYQKTQWITLFNTILIVMNIVIYLLSHNTGIFGESDYTLQKGALSWYMIKKEGDYYRLLTSMFLHSDFEHLMNNMLVLFFVGDKLERAAGKLKYLAIYFGSGIIAGISSISYNMIKNRMIYSVGASGAIFGVVGAMGYILLVNKGRIKDINSRQIILFTVFSLYGGIANVNIDVIAHIGGFIGGIILALILYRRPKRLQKGEGL